MIEEKIYPLENPENELARILPTGSSPYAADFIWTYHYGENLAERLLLLRYPHLDLLIIRITRLGPALAHRTPPTA